MSSERSISALQYGQALLPDQDGGYMYKILTGQRNAPKIVQAIREILELPEEGQDSA